LSKNLAEVRGVERPEREAWSAWPWRLSRREREEAGGCHEEREEAGGWRLEAEIFFYIRL
jgi:hypothetical protein